jgi:hypothetical protein
MGPKTQAIWDCWGGVFISRTLKLPSGERFRIADVFAKEWGAEIDNSQKAPTAKAIKAAFDDPRYRFHLRHVQSPKMVNLGRNHEEYRRL